MNVCSTEERAGAGQGVQLVSTGDYQADQLRVSPSESPAP